MNEVHAVEPTECRGQTDDILYIPEVDASISCRYRDIDRSTDMMSVLYV